jgi:hypothetical protein
MLFSAQNNLESAGSQAGDPLVDQNFFKDGENSSKIKFVLQNQYGHGRVIYPLIGNFMWGSKE